MSDDLFAAALTSITSTPIISSDDYQLKENGAGGHPLDAIALHQTQLVMGPVRTTPMLKSTTVEKKPEIIAIFIKTLTGKVVALPCCSSDTVEEVKGRIQKTEGTRTDQQKLMFSGQQLSESSKTLDDYGILDQSTVTLIGKGRNCPIIYVPHGLRDPTFDYDFSDIKDDQEGNVYVRGDYEYRRPCGWHRMALNVLDKFDDCRWLGVGRMTTRDSADGEWPVAYHGTGTKNLKSIAQDGFLLSDKIIPDFPLGRGIYTTPDVDVAEAYASDFTFLGDRYKVVIQSRVNPANLKIVSNEDTAGSGEYWIVGQDRDVRPYGICIKKV